MSDGPQEYEVESVTRARVHDKKGRKITWKYFVKWKGYDWNDSTWEPTDSFQGGSEHILESFWERIDTGGRDISDASAFKKGEELVISGPPGKKPLKRKMNPDASSSNGATISAPPLSPRKRRRVQLAGDNEYSKLKRTVSTVALKKGGSSTRSRKRRRASSPGPRKLALKRQPSAGDSQPDADADGETDPDVVEVEDELMQVSPEDAEEDTTRARYPGAENGTSNESKLIAFDDLEHFYSGYPIDIDQNTDEQVAAEKKEAPRRPQTSASVGSVVADDASEAQAPASPTVSAYDPLFDSPEHFPDKAPETQRGPILPHHRARTAKPLVKLIDAPTVEGNDKQSPISAKARLSSHPTIEPSTSGSSGDFRKRGGKPGPGRSSANMILEPRSSLLTAARGTLKSVKGKFASTTKTDQPDEIEDVPVACGTSEREKVDVTSWSDEDVDQVHQTTQPGLPPSGDEILELAGLKADPEPLPDYEDDLVAQPEEVQKIQMSNVASVPVEKESLNHSSAEAKEEFKTNETVDDRVADNSPSVAEARQQPSDLVVDNPAVPSVATTSPVDEVVKKNIELAKEHLFPSSQIPSNSNRVSTQPSFRSTIFGPLYQGSAANHAPVDKDELSTTFKVILGDGVELPMVLKDRSEIKARMGDILIGNSSGSKVALFYSAEDALAMVSTLKGDGTARVVLDPSAEAMQRERFSAFLQRFQSSHTLIAPVGKEVCVLYSSENASIAEKLGVPTNLRGLSGTILISHASIENQLAYVGAIMKAAAL